VFWRPHQRKRLPIVCVDDSIITGNDVQGITYLKWYLHKYIQTKDLESLRYFLGIKVAKSRKEITLFHYLICSLRLLCCGAELLSTQES